MNNLTMILRAYTEGEATLEETNAKLAELGTDLRLDPARNVITEAERTTHGLLGHRHRHPGQGPRGGRPSGARRQPGPA